MNKLYIFFFSLLSITVYSQPTICSFTQVAERTNGFPNPGDVFDSYIDGGSFYLANAQGLVITDDSGSSHRVITDADGLPAGAVTNVIIHNGVWYVGISPVGLDPGGLAISDDMGATFRTIDESNGLVNGEVTILRIDNDNIYVWSESGNNVNDSGVSVSTDGGMTFVPKVIGSRGVTGFVNDRAFDVHQGIIYIATSDGVFTSTDNGDSYTKAGDALPTRVTRIDVFENTIVTGHISSPGGYSISTDGGATFTHIIGADITMSHVFDVFINGNTIVLAGFDNSSGFDGKIAISRDLGATFEYYSDDRTTGDNLARGAQLSINVQPGFVLIGANDGYAYSTDCAIDLIDPAPTMMDDIEIVPTLGEWSIIVLGLLLLIICIASLKEMRTSLKMPY